jgi:hypothetical protein
MKSELDKCVDAINKGGTIDFDDYTTEELLAIHAEAKQAIAEFTNGDNSNHDSSAREFAYEALHEVAKVKVENEQLKTALADRQETPSWVGQLLNEIAQVQTKSAEPWVPELIKALKDLKSATTDPTEYKIDYDNAGRMVGFTTPEEKSAKQAQLLKAAGAGDIEAQEKIRKAKGRA